MQQDRTAELLALLREVRHDANNPLTAALGNVQLALGEAVLPEAEVRRTLHVVEAELLKLAAILRRLDAARQADPATPPPA